MRIGPREFRPGLWPSVATALLLPLLIGLGVWQMQRAEWKQGLIDGFERQSALPPVDVNALQGMPADWRYRRVTVRGQYDLAHQILLDNRIHQGRAGYHVLTPLALDRQNRYVLVNRGWLPLGASRAERPDLPGPAGVVTVTGLVQAWPDRTFRLDSVEEDRPGWPVVVQQRERSALEQRLGYHLMPFLVQLDAGEAGGFVRDWKAVYGISPDKHRAYAMQWFTLALLLVLIYLGVNTKRVSVQRNGEE